MSSSSTDLELNRGPHGELLTVVSSYGEQAWNIANQYGSRAVTYWNYLPPDAQKKAAELINTGIEGSQLTRHQQKVLVNLGVLARKAYRDKDGDKQELLKTAWQAGKVITSYLQGDEDAQATHQGGVSIEPIN